LHTPFLKLALLDRDFFEHPQHPARRLLNQLVDAGVKWVEPGSEQRSRVFQEMQTMVQRILKEFEDDITLFAKLTFEFSAFTKQHQRRIEMAEQRARQAAEGEDRLRAIRQKVTQLIDNKSRKMRLPQPIKTLLYEPWTNFLQFNLLRHGKDSEQWKSALHVVDDLLWFILPKHNMEDKARSDAMQTELFASLNQGFETVGYDKDKGQKLIKALALCQRLSSEDLLSPEPAEEIEAQIEQPESTTTDPKVQAYIKTLEQADFGTWFVFNAKHSKQKYLAKLVWYNVQTNHYMFVNKLGQQVKVCGAQEMAEQMVKGDVAVVEDQQQRPFFEKALEAILNQMQR
jgi:hypothetical protein